VRKHVQGHIAV